MKSEHLSESDILDDQQNLLDTEKSAVIKEHLRACSMCRSRSDNLQKLFASLDSIHQPVAVPESLVLGVLREVRREKTARETHFSNLRWLAGVAAAAALLLIILNPHPIRKASLQVADTQRTSIAASIMQPEAAPRSLQVNGKAAWPEEMMEDSADLPATTTARADIPEVQVLARAATPAHQEQLLMAGAVPAKKAFRKAADTSQTIPSEPNRTARIRREIPPPAAPGDSRLFADTFQDYAQSKEPAGNGTGYLLTATNTNTVPLTVSFTLSLENPSWDLVSHEPDIVFSPILRQTWKFDLTIPPSTNRTIRYQVMPRE